MELKAYLYSNYSKRTAYSYLQRIEKYFLSQENPKESLYRDIVKYIGELREAVSYNVAASALTSIKAYYNFLMAAGLRQDHPCKNLCLKDKKKNIQLQDLFNEKELESLLDHESLKLGYKTEYAYQLRSRCILQLLIYQGLQSGEIVRLRISDVNFEKGSIYIASSAVTNSRELKLRSDQVMNLYKYKTEDREVLLKKINQPLNNFFLTAEAGIGNQTICLMVRKMQGEFSPRKLNPVTIRQSVITNKLKKADIRIVQAFSGHKTTTSLQQYSQSDVEQLKEIINKYHPLQ